MNIDIEGTVKKINMMKDNKERFRIYRSFLYYLNHLERINMLDNDEINYILSKLIDTNKLINRHELLKFDNLDDIGINIYKLNGLYRPILEHANKYSIFGTYYPSIPQKDGFYYLQEFLKLMGDNVYNLFKTLLKEDLMYEKGNYENGGTCAYIDDGLSSIIVRQNIPAIYKIIAIAHEMGHAYDNYLNKTADYIRCYQINSEVTSMTFEQLFIYFLKENNVLNTKAADMCQQNFMYNYLLIMNGVYFLNRISLDNNLPTNEKLQITEKDIDIYSIIHTSAAYDYLNQAKFYDNYYGIGLIFSSILLKHFKKDYKSAIKEIKELSLLSQNMKTAEILNYYSKTDLINATNQNTSKTFCKRY